MTGCNEIASCFAFYVPQALEVAFGLVAAASAIAAITPTPRDDAWVGKVYRLVDLLALNVGHAKDQPGQPGGRFVPE